MSLFSWFRKNDKSPALYEVHKVPFQKGSKKHPEKLIHQFDDNPVDVTITTNQTIESSLFSILITDISSLDEPTTKNCVASHPWNRAVGAYYCQLLLNYYFEARSAEK